MGVPDWALLLDLSEVLFAWADVLLLVDECFVLLPFYSTGLHLSWVIMTRIISDWACEYTVAIRYHNVIRVIKRSIRVDKLHLNHFHSLPSELRQGYCDDTEIQDAWGGGEGVGGRGRGRGGGGSGGGREGEREGRGEGGGELEEVVEGGPPLGTSPDNNNNRGMRCFP